MYRAFCLSFALLLFVERLSFSETGGWAATYGGANRDIAYSSQQTRDGGYIVAGSTRSFGAGKGDVWVLKLRPNGAVEWQKTYGEDKLDLAYSICQTNDGGYIVAGWTESFGARNQDLWILKLRVDGTAEWQKTYGGKGSDEAYTIQETSDGGFVVAGCTTSLGDRGDLWVLKLKPNGAVEWQKAYGEGDINWANSIQEASDGGYIVAGWTMRFSAAEQDLLVLKLRADGTVEWQKTYGGGRSDRANSIQETSDGGYIVTGWTASFGAGMSDVWVLKLGPDGTVEWQKTYGGKGLDEAHSIKRAGDGGYIVAGWTGSFGVRGWQDIWVLKLKADGTVEWQKTYGGNGADNAYSVQETRDGGYIVAGDTDSFGVRDDIWVLKLRSDGSLGVAQDKSIDPSCKFIRDTSVSGKDSSATVKGLGVSARNSRANPRDSSAKVLDTNVSTNLSCP